MSNQEQLYLYKIVESTKAIGRGNRFAIWVQGCDKCCINCIVPDSWSTTSGGYYTTVDALASKIATNLAIEGVTISGGEPFLQSEALFALIHKIQSHDRRLSVIVYTGYLYEELRQNTNHQKLLSVIDLLIDGEYIDVYNNDTPLVGSSNQTVNILTDIGYELALEMQKKHAREIEILIENQHEVFMIGIPPKTLNQIFKE